MKKIISAFIAMLTCIVCFSFTCSAYDYPLVKLPDPSDTSVIANLVGDDYEEDPNCPYKEWMKVSGNVLYYDSMLDGMDYDVKVSVMRTFVEDFAALCRDDDVDISNITKQAVYNSVSDEMGDEFTRAIPVLIEATSADIYGALGVFSPFQGTFGTILGVIVILIIAFLVGTTIIDLAFLGMPRATEWFLTDDVKGKKMIWVSMDAYQALRKSNETNSNPYLHYFKSRIISYIILACCILYLLTGQIAQLIGWFLDYANQLVK